MFLWLLVQHTLSQTAEGRIFAQWISSVGAELYPESALILMLIMSSQNSTIHDAIVLAWELLASARMLANHLLCQPGYDGHTGAHVCKQHCPAVAIELFLEPLAGLCRQVHKLLT